MATGANSVHIQLREALSNYIKSQYFGKTPILLSAMEGQIDRGEFSTKNHILSPLQRIRLPSMVSKNPKNYLNG